MNKNLLPIAKEGWNYIAGAVLLFFVFKLFDFTYLSFILFIVVVFFVYIFRNPEREQLLYQEDSVASPVDGLVVSIDELLDDKYMYKVEIDGSYRKVSLLRVPFMALLKSVKVSHGARLSSKNELHKSLNESVELVFVDRKENSLKVLHRLKESFVDIEIKNVESQTLLQGSRYGFMLNGTTTLYLPRNFRLNINIGDELIASNSLIGFFTSEPTLKEVPLLSAPEEAL
ncbi:phosphatidylserine decarboxylase [Sulfurimonas sp.]|uniref:phosphatidylserine decarboxylase n=1 Tax=Sulfurimonas sp. TaxID=2022749 RepID=UPI0025CC0142|nr:phosphatidylserine decarboxylase [Sulfurimonas sp.]MDD5157262.1 phosphatidylserine decarboxylase [Sulfurimonas sp.]